LTVIGWFAYCLSFFVCYGFYLSTAARSCRMFSSTVDSARRSRVMSLPKVTIGAFRFTQCAHLFIVYVTYTIERAHMREEGTHLQTHCYHPRREKRGQAGSVVNCYAPFAMFVSAVGSTVHSARINGRESFALRSFSKTASLSEQYFAQCRRRNEGMKITN